MKFAKRPGPKGVRRGFLGTQRGRRRQVSAISTFLLSISACIGPAPPAAQSVGPVWPARCPVGGPNARSARDAIQVRVIARSRGGARAPVPVRELCRLPAIAMCRASQGDGSGSVTPRCSFGIVRQETASRLRKTHHVKRSHRLSATPPDESGIRHEKCLGPLPKAPGDQERKPGSFRT